MPDKVYHIHEMDADEAKKMMMGMSMDNTDDDRWWEQTDLTRLYLSSNCLSSISPKISNLMSLQVLDVSLYISKFRFKHMVRGNNGNSLATVLVLILRWFT